MIFTNCNPKRIILIVILFCCYQQLFSQNNFSVYINANYAIHNKPVSIFDLFTANNFRKYGTDIGVRYKYSLSKNFSLEGGLTASVWGRDNYRVFNFNRALGSALSDTKIQANSYSMDFAVLDFKIPLLIVYELKKLNFKIGPVLYSQYYKSTFFNISNIELFGPTMEVEKKYTFGYIVDIGYEVTKNIAIDVEYAYQFNRNRIGAVNLNEDNLTSIVGLGVSYIFNKK